MKMKFIEGYEDYIITSEGEIYSTRFKGRKMKSRIAKSGYKLINLYKNKVMKTFGVHRLVAIAFILNPLNKSDVNHINEDKTDNNIENLEWNTHKENNNWGTGSKRSGEKRIKPKEYYETTPVRMDNFKLRCKNNGWDYNSFKIIGSVVRIGSRLKYYYKEVI